MKNIVFDAKCLSYKFVKNNERSGIFFVAYNVFLELSKNYNISLYFKDEDFFLKHYYQFFNDDVYNKSQIYNDVGKYLQKIPNLILKFGKLTQEKKKERNKIKKIWLVIKLFFLKKIIKIYKAKDFDNNLKNMDFYISPAYMIPEKISKNDKIKKAIILYDTVPDIFTEEYFKNINREEHWYTQMTRKLNKYLYCFCISKSTKDNFLKYYKDKLDENKMI
ncbi:MAG: hypothetical protein PHY80_05380, partial [Rickettsiales bacterium]|nr:hypothetical protein [Rickettsiales bacterium]